MTTPRPALVVGNWKMNGLLKDGLDRANLLAGRLGRAGRVPFELVICPPATLLWPIAEAIRGSPLLLGAQDCHAEPAGAHTGDVSAAMLADAGCRFVIVGHSERRAAHREGDDRAKAKAESAIRHGLTVILCVGEGSAERERGETFARVERQIATCLPAAASAVNTVIAYEPVWAIGSGRTPRPAEIEEVHGRLRAFAGSRLRDAAAPRVLYGGSVRRDNARDILSLAGIDGVLVGGASLDADEFWAIAEASIRRGERAGGTA
ncbi:MAG: triose-phosphate isomerase [Alphaproteobacteria bacterium]